jgi:hypothetical protein
VQKGACKLKQKSERKANVNSQIHIKGTSTVRFGLDTNQANLLFKPNLPTVYVARLAIKNKSISRSPDSPAACDDNLPENRTPKCSSCFYNHIQGGRFKFQCMPRYVQQSILNGHSKKRCMQVSSLPLLQIVIQEFVFPSQQIPRVQAVLE